MNPIFFYVPILNLPLNSFFIFLLISASIGLEICQIQFRFISSSSPLFKNIIHTIHSYLYFGAIGAIIGANWLDLLIQHLVSIHAFQKPNLSSSIWQGGFVYWGGLIGFLIFFVLYSIRAHIPCRFSMDIISLAIPICHSIGRLGCICVGCCFGNPMIKFNHLGLCYPPSSFAFESFPCHLKQISYPLFPFQHIEAISSLAILGILLKVYQYKSFNGQLMYVYVILYSTVRFLLEWVRGDAERGIFFSIFSTSQLLSIFFCLFLLLLNIISFRKNGGGGS
ncbi:MAG: prolipoprotein diacylglyceryl transferase [Deltaproteobacteria bacterium]|nr:MAG: prolipoprotein diacylglyceryl transferase [Deltaproteobacteria bacterium]